MNYIDKRVMHKTFGTGVIVGQEGNYITVRFSERPNPYKFVCPDAFKTFLTLLDAEAAQAAEAANAANDLAKKKEFEEKNYQRAVQQMQAKKDVQSKGKAISIPHYASTESFFSAQNCALVAEIMYLKANGGKRIRLLNGVLIDRKQKIFVYCFESDAELNYPDGTQLTLWYGSNGIAGTFLGCEELAVYIASEENLGEEVPSIEFSVEAWRLLDFLTKRLDEIKRAPSPIVSALIQDGSKRIQFGKPITVGQTEAAKMAQAQPITFIWGPPGTGKTWTLAKIALEHMAANRRVLMLSYSNVSVDGATLRVFGMDESPTPGRVVRYGYPRDKELLAHPYLSSYNLTISRYPELLKERTRLLADIKRMNKTDKRILVLRERLKQIRTKLENEEAETVRKASFVATTVSKAIADKVLYLSKFDVVIFDEASMAYIPQIIFSAGLAKKHFVCIGDFAQLPPIVQGNNASILNCDIFQYCRITDAVENGHGHEWLCMLNEQRRMHPDIAAFASARMYHGLLKSHPDMERNRVSIVNTSPFPGNVISLADMSGMMSVCTKTLDESRINVLSALVSISLAIKAAKQQEVGIIAPYHAQSKLLHSLAHDVAVADPTLKKITCATVHQFQGSEKDVIVYDAVDCYRMKFPGVLLTSQQNNYANRLFNVAMSRAKGKFVSVCNADYFISKSLSAKLMFRQLIDDVKQKNLSRYAGNRLKQACDSNICNWFDTGKGDTLYIDDLNKAKKEIRIDMPAPPAFSTAMLNAFLKAIDQAKKRGVQVYIRVEDKAGIPLGLQKYVISHGYITNPVSVIDRTITWFGLPNSTAQFIAEGKTLPTTYRPIIRFVGKKFASALYGLLSMDKVFDDGTGMTDSEPSEYISFSSYVASKKKCPDCGKALLLKKGKKPFIGCSGYPSCHYTAFVEEDLLEEYFYHSSKDGKLCPHDGTTIVAEHGKYGYGPYIHCCGLTRHTFKIEDL